jgi:hypothetical protein
MRYPADPPTVEEIVAAMLDGAYWPRQVSEEEVESGDLAEYEPVFRDLGFERCADGSLVTGLEKLAIYASEDEFAHVAYQRPDGSWSSKLGRLNDVRHDDPRPFLDRPSPSTLPSGSSLRAAASHTSSRSRKVAFTPIDLLARRLSISARPFKDGPLTQRPPEFDKERMLAGLVRYKTTEGRPSGRPSRLPLSSAC